MKKIFILFLAVIIVLSGCGEEYETGMFSDVRDFDFYESAVKLCIENGYFDCEGDYFGAYDPVSLSECAYIAARLDGKNTDNAISYVLKKGIAEEEYPDWDLPATRAQAAYMISHAVDAEEINTVIEGAISDISDCSSKDEIYHLYRAGIFSGDKETNTFRPDEVIVRAEMAVVIERALDSEKRISFSMDRLEASLIAFGDTIGHMPVVNSCKSASGYDFSGLFKNVRSYIDEADIACVNQETIFIDTDFSGYPAFGSPCEIGEAEYEAGFDVVTHATNHAFDRGEKGVIYTTSFWKDKDIAMLGIHESEEDAEEITVIERNGIRIALLNYTYGLNGYRLPDGKKYLVDILDEDKVRSDMEKAKALSDGVIAFLHFGTEYRNTPTDEQKTWAQLFADEGAVAVIGAHPHVVEPMETIKGKNGNEMPVYYSLGNFISSQNDLQCALCAMAQFTIVKDEKGVRAENAQILPVITHMEKGGYTAYLLSDYPEEMERRHRFNQTYPGKFSKEYFEGLFESITG